MRTALAPRQHPSLAVTGTASGRSPLQHRQRNSGPPPGGPSSRRLGCRTRNNPNRRIHRVALTGSPTGGAALSVTNATASKPAVGFHVSSTASPFTVSSSTKVANLNADLLDGIDSTGFQKHSDLVRMDAVINFGATQSWDIGPYITIYATCTKDASGNRIFTQRLLNNSPSSGQWVTGELAGVSATNPATPETHGGSAGSGGTRRSRCNRILRRAPWWERATSRT